MVGQRPTLNDDPDPAQIRPRWSLDIGDAAALLGLVLLAIGLASYDWRLALIVVGILLLSAAVIGAWRAGHGDE